MQGTKKQAIPIKTMKSILRLVLDRRNHPLLIHCNHGKVTNTLLLSTPESLNADRTPSTEPAASSASSASSQAGT